MKSAYERAMERFGGQEIVSLTDEQKKALAEIDDKYRAKIAERELFLGDLIKKAVQTRSYEGIAPIEEQKRRDVAKLEREREEAKEKIRQPDRKG